jgi:hypothetical protein
MLLREPDRIVPEPPPPELYNIADDPLEQRNLADEQPERVRRMMHELENWFDQVEGERRALTPDVYETAYSG